MKPAASYFAENYASDFRKHGNHTLCGAPLAAMMEKWHAGRFPHFPEYVPVSYTHLTLPTKA